MKREIRFESGTTAITVFDEMICSPYRNAGRFLHGYTHAFMSQDTCRIFIGDAAFGVKCAAVCPL